jgi:hypothetical protein
MTLPGARGERRGRPRLETKLSSVMRDALRKRRHGTRRGAGISWSVDETDLKVRDRWCYLYRAINRHSNLIDAMLSEQRAMKAVKTVEFHRELTRLGANFPLRIDPRSNLPRTGRRVRSRKNVQDARHRPGRGDRCRRSANLLGDVARQHSRCPRADPGDRPSAQPLRHRRRLHRRRPRHDLGRNHRQSGGARARSPTWSHSAG